MGWFGFGSGSSTPDGPKRMDDGGFEAPDRSNRAKCWGARDRFFACLDQHDILDSIAEGKLAGQKCGPELAEFEKACANTWVSSCSETFLRDITR